MSDATVTRSGLRATVGLLVLAGAVGVVALWPRPTNHVNSVVGLAATTSVESSALYCDGFTGAGGAVPARVLIANTTSEFRPLTAAIVTSAGAQTSVSTTIPPHGTYTLGRADFPGQDFYGVRIVAGGGGLVATVDGEANDQEPVPCLAAGGRRWTASGLSTTVGTTTIVSILNVAAEPAAVSVSALTSTGLLVPLDFQGVVVPPHGLGTIDIGTRVVNSSSVALSLVATRGSVVVAATESWTSPAPGAVIVGGSPGSMKTALFAASPTASAATSTLEFANFGADPRSVRVAISIPTYHFPLLPFTLDVPGQSVTSLQVSPSTRIPSSGSAALTVTSSGSLTTTLVLTDAAVSGPRFLSAAPPVRAQAVGIGVASPRAQFAILNPHPQPVTVSWRSATGSGHVTVKGHSSVLVPATSGWTVISSTSSVAAVGIDRTAPHGIGVAASSGGR